jgi:hypothetical protein
MALRQYAPAHAASSGVYCRCGSVLSVEVKPLSPKPADKVEIEPG